MIRIFNNILFASIVILLAIGCTSSRIYNNKTLVIQDQGSFSVGGSVIEKDGVFDPIKHGAFNPSNQSSEGQSLHGDHAYVFYQIPKQSKKLPLVFWHGYGQYSNPIVQSTFL